MLRRAAQSLNAARAFNGILEAEVCSVYNVTTRKISSSASACGIHIEEEVYNRYDERTTIIQHHSRFDGLTLPPRR